MNFRPELVARVKPFLDRYRATEAEQVWKQQSSQFRSFWTTRVMAADAERISDQDCDQVIRILDRNAKGNTKGTEAVAKAMVPQGAWRNMLNHLHLNRPLGKALDQAFNETDPNRKAAAIDEVYALNTGAKNYLTGSSGNAICSMLAAWDPVKNLSVISLKHRVLLAEYLQLEFPSWWAGPTVGTMITELNSMIFTAGQQLGLPANARTISRFFYEDDVEPLWRQQHVVKGAQGEINVSVPTTYEEEEDEEEEDGDGPHDPGSKPELRESFQVQAMLAKIGVALGFKIWLPRNDRSRVLKAWQPSDGDLAQTLPLGFDFTTTATVEQIDVLWLRNKSIARAFEVEHTTAIYSGLLRMADLVALQPNLKVKLHIVAGLDRREKVMREIQRPTFALLEGGALKDHCTFISYDNVRAIASLSHLDHYKESILDEYEERAEDEGDAI